LPTRPRIIRRSTRTRCRSKKIPALPKKPSPTIRSSKSRRSNFVADWGPALTYEGKTVDASSQSLEQLILLTLGGLIAVVVVWWTTFLEREFPIREQLKRSEPLKDSSFIC